MGKRTLAIFELGMKYEKTSANTDKCGGQLCQITTGANHCRGLFRTVDFLVHTAAVVSLSGLVWSAYVFGKPATLLISPSLLKMQ